MQAAKIIMKEASCENKSLKLKKTLLSVGKLSSIVSGISEDRFNAEVMKSFTKFKDN